MITCPACGAKTATLETRDSGNYVRRRRECVAKDCGLKITTAEFIVSNPRGCGDLVTVKRRDIEDLRLLVLRLIPPGASQ